MRLPSASRVIVKFSGSGHVFICTAGSWGKAGLLRVRVRVRARGLGLGLGLGLG